MRVFLLILCCLLPFEIATASATSWSATAEHIRVDVPGRLYQSTVLANPGKQPLNNGQYGKVTWHFSTPYWTAVDAWLCLADLCDALLKSSGQSTVFKGKSTDFPLYFQFRLSRGNTDPVMIEGLKVLVNAHSNPELNPE